MKSLGVIFLAGLASCAVILLWPKPYHEPSLNELFAAEPPLAPHETANLGEQ
ncbi:MAG: hypothetical protein RLN72_11615 [Henriciella sp.]